MGFAQARILECAAISSSRGSSPSRDGSDISHIDRQILYRSATWEAPYQVLVLLKKHKEHGDPEKGLDRRKVRDRSLKF